MKVTEALYPNANPSSIKEDIKSFALNVMYNEDGGTLVNENGFKLHKDYSFYGTCIGTIPIPTGVVLFFVDESGVSKKDTIIYHSDSNIEDGSAAKDKIYLSVAYDDQKHTVFNFSKDRPITGSYSYNKNKHLIITWTEGNTDDANETRLLNLDTVYDDYKEFFGGSYVEGETAIHYQFDENYADIASFSKRLNLIPDVQYPNLTITAESGGTLLMGAYQFAIAYKLKTGEYTDYSLLSPVYYAAPLYNEDISVGNITTRQFKISLKDLDTQYSKYKIGIIYKNETDEQAFEYDDLSTTEDTTVYINNTQSLIKVDLNDIVIGTISYIKDQAHTNFNSQLIRANVSTNDVSPIDDYIKEQNLASTAYIDVECKEANYHTTKVGSTSDFIDNDLSNLTVVKDVESYFLYIGLIDYKGKLINCYPIRNTDTSYAFITPNFNNGKTTLGLYRWHINPAKFFDHLFNDSTIKDLVRFQVKAYTFFYAQANDTNHSWLSNCLILRDTYINNVIGNNYKLPFKSNERYRLYPLEYLITDTKLGKCYLNGVARSRERMTGEFCLNRAGWEDGMENDLDKLYSGVFEGGDVVQSVLDSEHRKVITRKDDISIDPMFYAADNSAISNAASESCYKIGKLMGYFGNLDASIMGDTLYENNPYQANTIKPIGTLNEAGTYNTLVDLKDFSDRLKSGGDAAYANKITINRQCLGNSDDEKLFRVLTDNNRSIVDLYKDPLASVDSELYANVDPYIQNLVASSPIITIKYTITADRYNLDILETETKGDTFVGWITHRCITPGYGYTHNNDTQNLHNIIEYCHRLVISYYIYSRLNIQCLHSGNSINTRVYKIFERGILNMYNMSSSNENPDDTENSVKDSSRNSEFSKVNDLAYRSQKIDNYWHTDEGACYDMAMNHDGFKDATITKDFEEYTNNYPARIIRSNVNPSEATDLGWRKYKANNYKDISIQKGQIENIMSDDVSLYIQQRFSLLVAAIKDTLSGGGNDDATYVGTSDIFQREPKEVIFSTTGKIGCNNRFSATVISLGYIVCDNEKGEIFICKSDTGVKEISDIGFKEWFKYHVPKDAINPYTANGTYFLYDELNNRLIFTCKVLDVNGDIDTSKAYTVSYSFKTGTWSSFHSYIGDYAYVNRKNSFYLKDSKIYEINAANKGIYFDNTINPSIVQFIYATEPTISKLFKHIEWRTQLIDGLLHKLKKIRYIYDKTFDHLMINTDVQSTGLIRLTKLPEWYASTDIKYKADRWLYNLIEDRIKTDSDYWNFNTNFLPFLSAKDVDDMIAISTIASKPWYEYAKIQNAWAYITFIYDNKFFNPNNDAYVETKDTKQLPFDYDEVITNDNLGNQEVKQLELRFTHVDVDVVKNNRV